MMKISIAIAFLTLVMVIGACGGDKTKVAPKEKKNVEARAMGDLKIAFYNQDSLKVYFKYYREQDSLVTKKQLAFQNEVQRRTAELQNYLINNDEKARKGLLSQNEIMQVQQAAQQKEATLMQFQQTEGAKIEEEVFNKLEAIGNKIEHFAQKYCEENGIDILLIYAKGGQINFINEAMDVTEDFTSYLNDQQTALEAEIAE